MFVQGGRGPLDRDLQGLQAEAGPVDTTEDRRILYHCATKEVPPTPGHVVMSAGMLSPEASLVGLGEPLTVLSRVEPCATTMTIRKPD